MPGSLSKCLVVKAPFLSMRFWKGPFTSIIFLHARSVRCSNLYNNIDPHAQLVSCSEDYGDEQRLQPSPRAPHKWAMSLCELVIPRLPWGLYESQFSQVRVGMQSMGSTDPHTTQ